MGVGSSFVWYRSTNQNDWVPLNNNNEYWIEEMLYTPGTYFYKLVVDDVESNIIEVTVVEAE